MRCFRCRKLPTNRPPFPLCDLKLAHTNTLTTTKNRRRPTTASIVYRRLLPPHSSHLCRQPNWAHRIPRQAGYDLMRRTPDHEENPFAAALRTTSNRSDDNLRIAGAASTHHRPLSPSQRPLLPHTTPVSTTIGSSNLSEPFRPTSNCRVAQVARFPQPAASVKAKDSRRSSSAPASQPGLIHHRYHFIAI